MSALALDTSVAVPLLVQTHDAHAAVVRWWDGRPVALSGHALVETYSVLTRLPGDLRLAAGDAARLISERFLESFQPRRATVTGLPTVLGDLGIVGGAVYDALVGVAAVDNGARLATRDGRARPTYELVGAEVVIAA